MKRAAIAMFLIGCVIGVVLLMLETGAERTSRRDVAAGPSHAQPAAGPAHDAPRDAATHPTDDDPNRVPGPDVTIRGRVLFQGAGVEGAKLVASRAEPYFQGPARPRDLEPPPPPIAAATSETGGHFELSIARRRRVMVYASHPGTGYGSLFLLLPDTGDPDDVKLHLREGGGIEGVVVDENDEPVADAQVRLTRTGNRRPPFRHETKTGADGRFALTDVARGSHRLYVKADGYPEVRRHAPIPAPTPLLVRLAPGGSLAGTVTDHAGAAVAGARVTVTTQPVIGRLYSVGEATTDATGAYRIELLPGAVAAVVVEHDADGRQLAPGQIDLPAKLVETGQELRFDIRLKPGVIVRGRAVLADAPAAGARITLLKANTQWRGLSDADYAQAGADGRFQFTGVVEGTYAIEAKLGDYAQRTVNRYAQAQAPLTVDFFVDGEHPPPEQKVTLEAGGAVRGRIVGVEIDPDRPPGVNVQTAGGQVSGTVDGRGVFVLANVPPMDEAVVNAWNPQAKSDPFAIEAGRTTEVTIDAAGTGGWSGIVEDEEQRPVAGARVTAMPEAQMQHYMQQFLRSGGWGSVTTGPDGRFRIPLGHWSNAYYRTQKFALMASHGDYALAITRGVKVPTEDATVEVTVTITRGGIVKGRVELEGGGPAVNLRVSLSPKKQQGDAFETRRALSAETDFDGRFEIRGVGPGPYHAAVWHHSGKAEPLEARAGDDDVRLVVRTTHAIAGVVVTKDGVPVAQAEVAAIIPTATGEQRRTAMTGATGRFRITHLDQGTYPIEVTSKPRGYGTAVGFETKRVEGVATATDNLVLTVEEGPALNGRVVDPQGRGVPSAGVIALSLKKPTQTRKAKTKQTYYGQGATRPSAITNGRGEFSLKGLGIEEVELVVLAEGYQPSTLRATAGDGVVTLRIEEGGVLEGRLLNTDGTPLRNQWLSFTPVSPEINAKLNSWRERAGQSWSYLGGWQIGQGRTDMNGAFRLTSLVPGEYRLQISVKDGVLPRQTLRTGGGSVTLRLQRALTIKGRVTDPDGNAIAPQGNQRVWLNAYKDGQWLPGATTDEDGYFELKGLPEGTLRLRVWAGVGFKTRTLDATAGERDLQITMERSGR